MVMKFLLLWVFLFSLSSCDPGFIVELHNNSKEDQQIKIVGCDSSYLIHMDSLWILDESNPGSIKYGWQAITSKNISENSYTFLLQSGKTAILRKGIGRPKADLSDILNKIIVNYNDTIIVRKDKRVKIDRKPMSTEAIISLE